jgi:hypothetical protein
MQKRVRSRHRECKKTFLSWGGISITARSLRIDVSKAVIDSHREVTGRFSADKSDCLLCLNWTGKSIRMSKNDT